MLNNTFTTESTETTEKKQLPKVTKNSFFLLLFVFFISV